MLADLSLIGLIVVQGLWAAVVGIATLSWLAKSRWFVAAIDKGFGLLPQLVQERINYFTLTQVTDKTPSQWIALRVTQGLLVIVVALVPATTLLKAFALVLLTWFWFYQYSRRRNYVQKAIREWPNALDMIAMLMHSGLSFRATLNAFYNTPSDSVAITELSRVQRSQQSGYNLVQSLEALTRRISHPWIELFVAAVNQAQSTGGELANTIQQQAEQCRQQQLLEAEKRAQEVSVKLMFPLIICFFPVTMLLILGPVFIGFLTGGLM